MEINLINEDANDLDVHVFDPDTSQYVLIPGGNGIDIEVDPERPEVLIRTESGEGILMITEQGNEDGPIESIQFTTDNVNDLFRLVPGNHDVFNPAPPPEPYMRVRIRKP